MECLKNRLRNKTSFNEAVPEFILLMNECLSFGTKRLFYNGLNIASFRVGKPGFDPPVAKPLFEAAIERNNCFPLVIGRIYKIGTILQPNFKELMEDSILKQRNLQPQKGEHIYQENLIILLS